MPHPEDKMPSQRNVMIATAVMGVIILVPSMVGFVNKLVEFSHVIQGDADGAFAMTPIVNYILATLGFLCLLLWATMHGMFYDIEGPKRTMLSREDELDADEPDTVPVWAGGHPKPKQSSGA
ncbi:MAG: hypothetical protein KDA80_06405 [Planctomycetaceae bacterium]|nr:hypothetical protein [Planctomycetaceae bacterium]